MIRGRIGSRICAGTLILALPPVFAAYAEVAPERAARARFTMAPHLYTSLLPRAGSLAIGDSGLLRAGGGMIELAPFGDGFRLSARDRPDRGGARDWSSLRAGAVGGMTFPIGLETSRGRNLIRKFAPALLLGYGARPERGLGFALEAGMLLRTRLLTMPPTGLSRFGGADETGRGHATALMQARIGYRF